MQFLDVQVQKEVKGSLRAVLVSPVLTLSSSLSPTPAPTLQVPFNLQLGSQVPELESSAPSPPC